MPYLTDRPVLNKFLSLMLLKLGLLSLASVAAGEIPPPPPLPRALASSPLSEHDIEESAKPFDSLKVPEGFEVTLFADDDLAHDIYSMTIDSQGRVVVSSAGYVRILHDRDGNGVADDVTEFIDGPKNGAMGMHFHGSDLICTGDAGLIRYRDSDGDDRADGPPDVFLKMKTGGEHDAHAIRRGPDGWWYVIAGNGAGINSAYVTLPTSPVKEPAAGTLMRLTPDLSGGEVFAHGMRNAYDFDFNAMGDIFTYDSDGERDVSLPWYRPTRVFQLLPGSHTGWFSRSWKRPGSFVDMPPVVGAFGRGSPTGVVCYRHTAFPEEYHNALFVMDWTFGRILTLPLKADDGVWSSKPREFMTAKGKFGFAPTDMAVAPDGSLYLSVGGRGTRGAIFRVTWKGTERTDWWEAGTQYLEELASDEGFEATTAEGLKHLEEITDWCLQAPQPLCSWSRGRWMPVARRLGDVHFRRAALDRRRPRSERIRAIEIMVELFGGFDLNVLKLLAEDPDTSVRARAAWALGRQLKTEEELRLLVFFIDDGDPLVVRSALEAVITAPPELDLGSALTAVARQLSAEQHFVRQTAARVVARLWPDQLIKLREITRDLGAQTAIMRELGISWNRNQPSRGGIEIGLAILEADFPAGLQKQSARLLQIALGDVGPYEKRPPVFDGYAPRFELDSIERSLDPYRVRVAKLYPSGDPGLDHELLRVIAMLQPYNVELLDRILNELTDDSHPTDDLHRLIAAARIPVDRSSPQTEKTARTLVQIDHKIQARGLNQDSNWDDRLKELFDALLEHDPTLADAIVRQEGFGLPPHVMYLSRLTAPDSLGKALEGFEEQITSTDNYHWTNDVVFVLGESTEPRHRALIREQFDNYSVRSAVLSVLANDPRQDDRDWFVEGLEAPLVEGVQASARALLQLEPGSDPEELFALLNAAQRLSLSTKEFAARETVMQVLSRALGNDYGFVFGQEGYKPQTEVMSKISRSLSSQYPEESRKRLGQVADQLGAILAMSSSLEEAGNPQRGRVVFERRSCARCHGGRKALGPDLSGVAKRFSRRDLLTSIVNPDQNVSSRYRTTMIVTDEGKVHTGLIVYRSVDGLILRDAESRTWRFEADEIELERKLPNSLMPAGLLKEIAPTELADLLAYLESL